MQASSSKPTSASSATNDKTASSNNFESLFDSGYNSNTASCILQSSASLDSAAELDAFGHSRPAFLARATAAADSGLCVDLSKESDAEDDGHLEAEKSWKQEPLECSFSQDEDGDT